MISQVDYEYQHFMVRKEFVSTVAKNQCYFVSLLESQIFIGNSTACTSTSTSSVATTQPKTQHKPLLGKGTAEKLMAQYYVILVSLLEAIEHIILKNLPPDETKTGQFATQTSFSDAMRRRTSSASSCDSKMILAKPPICSIKEFWVHLSSKQMLIHYNPLYLQRYDAINMNNSNLAHKNSK